MSYFSLFFPIFSFFFFNDTATTEIYTLSLHDALPILRGEKFGVMPFFCRQRLLDIQGWDEAFIGWGAEDQDLIERYLGQGRTLCRSPRLVYLHLHHEAEPQWREAETVASNRQTYYQKRQEPISPSPEA